MSLWQAILMGIIQGLTEFLPVSSSGHLAILGILFDIEMEGGMLFSVMLHLGTLLSVCLVYFKDVKRLIVGGLAICVDSIYNIVVFVTNKMKDRDEPFRRIIHNSYRKMVLLIIVSTIPTAIIGYAAKDLVETASLVLLVPGICLIITGILLLIADYCPKGWKLPKTVTYSNAFIIGICQGIATLPGLSRSGTTITASLLSGFDRRFAVKYSFLMSIPAVVGAAILELKGLEKIEMNSALLVNYIAGTLTAAVVGFICIKVMLLVVRRKKFKIFAFYCFAAGLVASIGFFLQ